jgi:hypothetical protein
VGSEPEDVDDEAWNETSHVTHLVQEAHRQARPQRMTPAQWLEGQLHLLTRREPDPRDVAATQAALDIVNEMDGISRGLDPQPRWPEPPGRGWELL